MPQCWASAIGDCHPEQSREHLVSAGLRGDGSIDVVGFPWCRHEPKRVGVASLTAKILCRKHNSALSPLDDAAKKAFAALADATELSNQRNLQRPRKWKVKRFEILGLPLERWFLKTAINLIVANPNDVIWGLDGGPVGRPPKHLVRIVYGDSAFVEPLGLYAAVDVGETMNLSDYVRFAPLLTDGNRIVAGMFTFRGVRFVLNLYPTILPRDLPLPGAGEVRWRSASLLYHVKRINVRVAERLSHYVQVLWHVEPGLS